MSENVNYDRRRFLITGSMTMAAAKLGMTGSADARSSNAKAADAITIKSGASKPGTSFGPLKQIDAGLLNV